MVTFDKSIAVLPVFSNNQFHAIPFESDILSTLIPNPEVGTATVLVAVAVVPPVDADPPNVTSVPLVEPPLPTVEVAPPTLAFEDAPPLDIEVGV